LVKSVPVPLRPYASSVSQFVFNILGYALSTVVSGIVMQVSGSRTWGFRTVLLWSVFGVLASFLALIAASSSSSAWMINNASGDPSGDSVSVITSIASPIQASSEQHSDDDLQNALSLTTTLCSLPVMSNLALPVQELSCDGSTTP
jgi:Na+/melibiose symporter-like transporter